MIRRIFILVVGLFLFGPNVFAGGGADSDQLVPTAKGRTGPVGLQLTLRQNKIKVGENLFVKTTLTNFSKEPMLVTEWIYRGSDNLGEVWSDNSCRPIDPDIEVRDSKGHRMKPNPYADFYSYGNDSPFAQRVGVLDVETARRIKILESQGLSDSQVTERLRREELERAEAKRKVKYPDIVLKQGQSVESVPWCSGRMEGNTPDAITCPGNGFVELPIYTFERPGRYRVRAVRDLRPVSKEQHKRATQWDVQTVTGWITFEVIR